MKDHANFNYRTLLLLVIFLAAIVSTVTLTGAASAQQNITDANRTIDGEVASSEIVEAEPGDELFVDSIVVAGDGIENPSVERLGILENFTAFDATIINDVTRNGGDANTVTETNTNDGVVVGIEEDTGPAFGAWESGDVFRVNYSVFVQADASDGDQYVFDGNATLGNEDVNLAGPDTIEINAPDFQLSNLDPEQTTIAEGEGPIDVSTSVENVGRLDGEQDVELTVTNSTGDVVLSQTETVSRTTGENATVTFSDIPVQNLTQGDYTHEISTDQDTINGSLTVAEPADYQLSNLDPADTVVADGGDAINISADVDNNGGVAGDQDVVLEVVNNQTGDIELTATESNVQIGAGGSQTVEFTDVDAGSLDIDDYTHRISTDQDTINGSLAVVQPATYEVSNLDPADAVVGNNSGTISISADVDNVGGVAGEKDISLEVTDNQNSSVLTDTETNVQIAAGDNQTVEFTGVDVGSLGIGDYSHTISSEDDSVTGTLSIVETGFQVTDLNPVDVTVPEDTDPIDVTTTVENFDPNNPDTQDVVFEVKDESGTVVYSATKEGLTLNASENATVTFQDVPVDTLAIGEYTHTVSTDDDEQSGTLTVAPGSFFTLDTGDGKISLWERSILPLTANTSSETAQTVVPHHPQTVNLVDEPERFLTGAGTNRENIAVFEPGATDFELASVDGADVSQFAGEEAKLVVAYLDEENEDALDLDLVPTNVGDLENRLSDGNRSELNQNFTFDMVSVGEIGQDGLEFQYDTNSQGSGMYTLMLTTGDIFTVDNGNITDIPQNANGSIVGMEQIAVHRAASDVGSPTESDYVLTENGEIEVIRGGDLTFKNINTGLPDDGTNNQVVAFYDEETLTSVGTRYRFQEEIGTSLSTDDVVVEHEISDLNGAVDIQDNLNMFGLSVGDRSSTGMTQIADVVESLANEFEMNEPETQPGNTVLDGSVAGVGEANSSATLTVETFQDFDIAEYRLIHLASANGTSDTFETSTQTIDVIDVDSITLTLDNTPIDDDETTQATVTATVQTPDGQEKRDFTSKANITSSDTGVATIGSGNVVTARNDGTTEIEASILGRTYTDSVQLTVNEASTGGGGDDGTGGTPGGDGDDGTGGTPGGGGGTPDDGGEDDGQDDEPSEPEVIPEDQIEEVIGDEVDLPENQRPTRAERANAIVDPDTGKSQATFSEDSIVESVEFTSETGGSTIVVEYDEEPEETGKAPGRSIGVPQVVVPEEARDSPGTIRWRISTARLEQVDAAPENLQSYRFANGEWQSLETEIEQTETGVRLISQTPGYSYFAVSAVSPPEPAFEVTPAEPQVGEEVTLNASASENPDGEIVSYDWDVNGEALSGEEATTTFDSAGEFEITLTVENDAGETATTNQTVTVTDVEPNFEVSELDVPAEAEPGDTLDVTATITNTGDGAGEGTVTYEFDGSQEGEETVQLESGGTTTVSFSVTAPESEGEYTHTVTIDDSSDSATTSVQQAGTDGTPDDEDDDGGFPLIILLVIAVLLIIGGAAAYYVTQRDE